MRSQLDTERADRAQAELKKQLDSLPTENQQDYDQLLESSSATIDNQRKVVALLQSRRREDREKFEAQLAELQKRLDEAERNLAPEIDLSDKAGKVASFFKTLLAKDTKLVKDVKQDKDVKLPKDTISKIEEILGGGDG